MNDQNQKDNDAEVTALDSLMPSSTPSDLGEIVDSVKREPSASAEIQAENERLREALKNLVSTVHRCVSERDGMAVHRVKQAEALLGENK